MKTKKCLFFFVVTVGMLFAIACSSTPKAGPVLPDIGGKVSEGRSIPINPVRLYLVEVELLDQSQTGFFFAPGGRSAGAKFEADFNIRNFTFVMTTWYNNTKNSFVFRLYNWNETYKETVNGDPIVVITKRNLQENELVTFDVDEGVAPPGTYLWTISDAEQKDPDACVAMYTQLPNPEYKVNAVFFADGYETDEFYHKAIIGGVRAPRVQPKEDDEQ